MTRSTMQVDMNRKANTDEERDETAIISLILEEQLLSISNSYVSENYGITGDSITVNNMIKL